MKNSNLRCHPVILVASIFLGLLIFPSGLAYSKPVSRVSSKYLYSQENERYESAEEVVAERRKRRRRRIPKQNKVSEQKKVDKKISSQKGEPSKKSKRKRRRRRRGKPEPVKHSEKKEYQDETKIKTIEGVKPLEDRWRILYRENLIDPYNQNILKGDRPVLGQDIFFTARVDSISRFEFFGTVPTPAGVSAADPIAEEFFGGNRKNAYIQDFRFTLELFKGDTSFRPRDWEIRLTPSINLTHINAAENGILSRDVRKGTVRTTDDYALEEASVEYHLFDLNRYYDFVSFKGGIQKFNSDFRGIIFEDSNLGGRLLGTLDNNIYQFNILYFEMLEKDTNSLLNTFNDRQQEVFIANIYAQDFVVKGYTAEFSVHYNNDGPSTEYDKNLFLARPDAIGDAAEHEVDVKYLGLAGEGHWGRVNVSHFFYYALGNDSLNNIAGREVDIAAFAVGLEFSIDDDWVRYRFSWLHASGDGDPEDGKGEGFDAILPNPNFVGGRNTYWIAQAIPLAGTGVQMVNQDSVFPSLRSSKAQGQANFVNPGINIYNIGMDLNFSPKIRSTVNLSKLSFEKTEPLELVLNQANIARDIGFDLSLGTEWRPWLNNNVIVDVGTNVLFPGEGFKDILTDGNLYSVTSRLIFTY